jgi:hypothetical protein
VTKLELSIEKMEEVARTIEEGVWMQFHWFYRRLARVFGFEKTVRDGLRQKTMAAVSIWLTGELHGVGRAAPREFVRLLFVGDWRESWMRFWFAKVGETMQLGSKSYFVRSSSRNRLRERTSSSGKQVNDASA